MSIILPVRYENKHCYDIYIENDYDMLFKLIREMNMSNRKACIVTESNVGPIYAKLLKKEFENAFEKVCVFRFQAGENSKNLNTVSNLYEYLILNMFDRNDVLLALGGGVVGDLTGFTAATYLRGIKFIQLPTSLLSQVDSSIGGKTGVDFNGYKNMVGAFYQPSLVYMNISTLKSLPKREFISGMGEIIKHGFIKDVGYLKWLKDNYEKILQLDFDTLQYMISESCMIKRTVVELDPKETLGERALLNFGHTLGHAIEKHSNFTLLHGECVALGMIAALNISYMKNMISSEDKDLGINIIKMYFSTTVSGMKISDVVETTKSDKKMDSNTIKFILLKSLGNAVIDKSVTTEDMGQALEEVVV